VCHGAYTSKYGARQDVDIKVKIEAVAEATREPQNTHQRGRGAAVPVAAMIKLTGVAAQAGGLQAWQLCHRPVSVPHHRLSAPRCVNSLPRIPSTPVREP